MAEEFDVFADAMKKQQSFAKPAPGPHKFHKKFNRGPNSKKPNNSPIRGANGE